MVKYALLIVLCGSAFIAALDEASIKKQLGQCLPSLIDQLKAATQKIDDCNAIETNAEEIMHEFADRWCFSTAGRQAWTEESKAGYPKRGFALALGDFWAAMGKIQATGNPLPAIDALVTSMLNLVKMELKDKCGSLEVACGKHLNIGTEIRGLECSYVEYRNEGRGIESHQVKETKKEQLCRRPTGIAFSFKNTHPDVRMEKTSKVIYDILCPNGELKKKESYKTMMFFKRDVEKAAINYTIA